MPTKWRGSLYSVCWWSRSNLSTSRSSSGWGGVAAPWNAQRWQRRPASPRTWSHPGRALQGGFAHLLQGQGQPQGNTHRNLRTEGPERALRGAKSRHSSVVCPTLGVAAAFERHARR